MQQNNYAELLCGPIFLRFTVKMDWQTPSDPKSEFFPISPIEPMYDLCFQRCQAFKKKTMNMLRGVGDSLN